MSLSLCVNVQRVIKEISVKTKVSLTFKALNSLGFRGTEAHFIVIILFCL
jgi:hypothetical protein